MHRKIIEHKIIEEGYLSLLDGSINSEMANGWIPIGNIGIVYQNGVSETCFIRMVKYEDQKKEYEPFLPEDYE